MAVSFQPPKVLSAEAMFGFWVDNLRKQRPYLIIRKPGNSRWEVWYNVKEELEYLKLRNLEMDAKIQELEVLDKNIKRFTPLTKEIFEFKKEIVNNKNKIRSLENKLENTKIMLMDYKTFKSIITCFNKKAADAIIQGKLLYLGNNLGYSQIRKIVPVIRKGTIDWKASNEYKKELVAAGKKVRKTGDKEGEMWLIYKNDPWYLRWAWIKHYTSTLHLNLTCRVKNNRVYAFYATNSTSNVGKIKVPGNKTKLAQAQAQDPLLHTRYFTMNMMDYVKQKKTEEKLEEAA